MLLGGRTAEELIFADPTTGAQNDIDRATTIARQMVTEFGMSDALGPMRFGHPQGEVFLGRDFTSHARLLRRGRGQHRRRGARAHRRRARGRRARCSTDNREILDRLAAELDRARDARSRAGAGALRRRAHVGRRTRPTPRRGARAVPKARRRRRAATAAAAAASPTDPTPRRIRVTDRARCNRCRARPATGRSTRAGSSTRCARSSRRSARTPTATGCVRTPRAHRRHVRGDLRRAPRGPVAAPHGHVRGRPRRDGHGARHPACTRMCEHHLVPFAGRAHVAYIPGDDGRITGLSKIAPPRRRLRQAAAGAGAAHHADRRRAGRRARTRAACS